MSDPREDNEAESFVSECLGSALLDSGCPTTVCGSLWLKVYIDSLSAKQKQLVEVSPCHKKYKFGNGKEVQAVETARIPVFFGKIKSFLTMDVIPVLLPLLLSKSSLQRGKAEINFENNTLTILGQKLPLYETKSGHLLVSLCRPMDIEQPHVQRILLNSPFQGNSDEEVKKKALKLHRQFTHPPPSRLKKLLQDSGVKDKNVFKHIDLVSKECETCQRLKKPPDRPVVGFPLATEFNEVVALDLKQLKSGIYVLHFIDHATRYSAGCIIRNKRKETIVDSILRQWIQWFGPTKKFLWDNGGEFFNDEVIELAERCNITILATAAESPWSNGVCERHNAIIAANIHKIRLDTGCSVEVALAWALCAKNCLANVHGFSPNQLVFGRNPNLPNILDNKAPANSVGKVCKTLEMHLNALNTARQEFVKPESSEKNQEGIIKENTLLQ